MVVASPEPCSLTQETQASRQHNLNVLKALETTWSQFWWTICRSGCSINIGMIFTQSSVRHLKGAAIALLWAVRWHLQVSGLGVVQCLVGKMELFLSNRRKTLLFPAWFWLPAIMSLCMEKLTFGHKETCASSTSHHSNPSGKFCLTGVKKNHSGAG